jgi:oligopeptide transport system substrate-binding protein
VIGTLKARRSAIAIALALVCAGCTGSETPAAAPGTYVIGLREPASLLPAQVADPAGRMITGALWTPLTSHDAETHEVTMLSAAAVTSSDHLTWTIKLRPGMRFHDGSPVTARSYAGAWQAAVSERWPGAIVLTDVLRAKDMRAVDDTTIALVLERPFAQVPLVLSAPALYPLPDSVLGTKDWAGFGRQPVGNGPYRMAEPWQGGSGARLVRFDGYVGNSPSNAREIALRVANDPGSQVDQVRSGALDVATEVPGARHNAMDGEFANRHVQWPIPEATYLGFPLSDKRFGEPVVRHAFAFAVDRAALETGPLDRQVDPARSYLPPSVALAQRSAQCRPCNHDPAAAKSLLGQVEGFTGQVILYHEAGQEPWVGPLVEQLRGALGLDVVARPLASGPAPPTLDGPFIVSKRFNSASPREPMINVAGYTGVGFADLLAAADAAADPAESGQLYRLAENQLLRDLPLVPLWSRHGHALWGDRVRAVPADPVRDLDLAAVELS